MPGDINPCLLKVGQIISFIPTGNERKNQYYFQIYNEVSSLMREKYSGYYSFHNCQRQSILLIPQPCQEYEDGTTVRKVVYTINIPHKCWLAKYAHVTRYRVLISSIVIERIGVICPPL